VLQGTLCHLSHILSITSTLEIVYKYINTFNLGAAMYTLCHLSPCPALTLSLTNTPEFVDILPHALFLRQCLVSLNVDVPPRARSPSHSAWLVCRTLTRIHTSTPEAVGILLTHALFLQHTVPGQSIAQAH